MKKVWIASILAILMLTVPLTSVVGANEVEDCNCNPVSDSQVVRIERLLDRLESRINFILSRYSHIQEVKEKCEGILELINSDILWDFPIICAFLESIVKSLCNFAEFILEICDVLDPESLIMVIFSLIYLSVMFPATFISYNIARPLGCEWAQLV